jgi:hypothetical protein
VVEEGKELVLFKGENLEPIFVPQEDPNVPWLMNTYKEQIGNLAGSAVLFGNRQPGVDTGYHNAQQLSQAEHLDEPIEQHLVQAAVNDATIVMLYCKYSGESLWADYAEKPGQRSKAVGGKYVELNPDWLSPLPRVTARVRKQRPIDLVAAVRTAKDASDERQGKGPLFSTWTNRTEVLGMSPEDALAEAALVEEEAAKNRLIASGAIDQQIQISMNLKLQQVQPEDQNPEKQAAGATPATAQALQALGQSTQAQGAGGIHPGVLDAAANNNPSGGMVAQDSEPEARVGEAAAVASGRAL